MGSHFGLSLVQSSAGFLVKKPTLYIRLELFRKGRKSTILQEDID